LGFQVSDCCECSFINDVLLEEKMGIRAKFITIISVLSLLATIAIGCTSYVLSRQNALADAKSKGEMLFNYIEASGTFFGKYQRPLVDELLVDKERFIPELMSRFVVKRMEYDIFAETQKGYQFKQATIDPLWPDNKADANELEIIEYFANNPNVKDKEGIIEKDGEQFFYAAKPVAVDKPFCLDCHSDPALAPKEQREIYGTENGYNWKMNEMVGTSMIYISVSEALATARASALKIFLIGIGSLLVTIACIWVFFDRAVVGPIVRLSETSKNISIGKNLCDSVHSDAKDEIGVLANSIDRLRISVNKLLKRSCPDRNQEKKD
jgi:HAMP domain-containing protein